MILIGFLHRKRIRYDALHRLLLVERKLPLAIFRIQIYLLLVAQIMFIASVYHQIVAIPDQATINRSNRDGQNTNGSIGKLAGVLLRIQLPPTGKYRNTQSKRTNDNSHEYQPMFCILKRVFELTPARKNFLAMLGDRIVCNTVR